MRKRKESKTNHAKVLLFIFKKHEVLTSAILKLTFPPKKFLVKNKGEASTLCTTCTNRSPSSWRKRGNYDPRKFPCVISIKMVFYATCRNFQIALIKCERGFECIKCGFKNSRSHFKKFQARNYKQGA